jgi:hypothetical protein
MRWIEESGMEDEVMFVQLSDHLPLTSLSKVSLTSSVSLASLRAFSLSSAAFSRSFSARVLSHGRSFSVLDLLSLYNIQFIDDELAMVVHSRQELVEPRIEWLPNDSCYEARRALDP